MRALLVALLLLTSLTCRSPLSIPAYLVGDAALAIVVADSTPAIGYAFGAVSDTLAAGDSVCLHFVADGNWRTVLLWNEIWPFLDIQWVPHEVARTLVLHFSGSARSTSVSPALC